MVLLVLFFYHYGKYFNLFWRVVVLGAFLTLRPTLNRVYDGAPEVPSLCRVRGRRCRRPLVPPPPSPVEGRECEWRRPRLNKVTSRGVDVRRYVHRGAGDEVLWAKGPEDDGPVGGGSVGGKDLLRRRD